MTSALTPVQRDLRQLAANYRLGGVINAIDLVCARRGPERVPASVLLAAHALQLALRELGLAEPGAAETRLLADVWRGVES